MNITVQTNGVAIQSLDAGIVFRYQNSYYLVTTHTDGDDNRDCVALDSGALVTFPYDTYVIPVVAEVSIVSNNLIGGEFQW